MICCLRPLSKGRLPSRFFSALAIAAATVACGTSSESSFSNDDDGAPASAPALTESESSCAPAVSGLVPAGIAPIEIACPRGYTPRATFAALPIAGRFSSLAELTEAFCIEKSATSMPTTDPRAPTTDNGIDFERNDVVAYAFDARAGVEPALFERGAELWLKVTTSSCRGEAPELASIAFVVPKAKKLNEQKCSLRCE